jgi:secretion/DNA translocation related TadE-like protein
MPTDRGSVALSIGFLVVAATLFLALVPAAQLVLARQGLARLTETAALAASDATRGLTPGFPCEIAETIAAADGARLVSCRIVRDGAIITLSREHLFFDFESVAYAGAP